MKRKTQEAKRFRWQSVSRAIDYVCARHPSVKEFTALYGWFMSDAELDALGQLVAVCRDGFLRPRDVSEYR